MRCLGRRSLAYPSAALLVAPELALAHSPMPGIEGFYTGMLHPAGAPEPLLCTLAIGLVLGIAGPAVARRAWLLYLVGLAVGLAAPVAGGVEPVFEWIPLAVALAAAAVALFGPVPWLASGLAGAGGLAVGLGSAPDPGPTGAVVITVAGSFLGANLLLLLVFGGVDVVRERLRGVWFLRATQVAAGWLIAIILMWGAFSYGR